MLDAPLFGLSYVPIERFRYGLLWGIAGGVILLGHVPLLYPPMRGAIGGLELSTWSLVLLGLAQLVCYGTDYYRRPLGQRAMAFAAGMLIYAGALIPVHRWLLLSLGGGPVERVHVINNFIIGDAYTMGPVLAYALRHTRLLEKKAQRQPVS